MKILNATQIKAMDLFEIQQKKMSSLELMERAANCFVAWFVKTHQKTSQKIHVICGVGNNGGDGLAVARILFQKYHYPVELSVIKFSDNASDDFIANYEKLSSAGVSIRIFSASSKDMPHIKEDEIVIDALLGTGLSRPLEDYLKTIVQHINNASSWIVSIDIPSGMFADTTTHGVSINANQTFTFDCPKLSFFFPENYIRVGEWAYAKISSNDSFLASTSSNYRYIETSMIREIYRNKSKFDHKGSNGHVLLIMGSLGKVGAAILATKSCLKTGAGLVTTHSPRCAYNILQVSVPEAMVSLDENEYFWTEIPDYSNYRAIGIGCGIGKNERTELALLDLLKEAKRPLVLDADALNILAKNKDKLAWLPENSILTPHPKEFDRLFGTSINSFETLKIAREAAMRYKVFIILKRAHTCIATPEGNCYFNSTGNPGMATAGTGDALTGMICALIAQGYTSLESSLLGVYLHGLAGDFAASEHGAESMLASDLISSIGKAFKTLH